MSCGRRYFPSTFALWALQLVLLGTVSAEKSVYFDKFGHCSRPEPFDLLSDSYLVKSTGGAVGIYHESLRCKLFFQAPPDNGVCITFKVLSIYDCNVSLVINKGHSKEELKEWKILVCKEKNTHQMCTSDRYVSLEARKKVLNSNKNYKYEILVEKSTGVTEVGALAASLGLVIGIIVGVIVLLVVLAFILKYFCRRHWRKEERSSKMVAYECRTPVEPSAPPAPPDVVDPLLSYSNGMYPSLELPPPYSERAPTTDNIGPAS